MTIHREYRGLPRAVAGGMQAEAARARTSPALRSSRARGASATPLPRSARRLGVAALLVAALACRPYVQGNGVFLEEDRSPSVGPFTGVHVEDGIDATVTSGAATQSVVVSGDANVVKYVKTEVKTETVRGVAVGVLHVSVDVPGGEFETTIPIRAVIRVRALGFAAASEDARIDVADAATPELVIEARGGSQVSVRGLGGTSLYATLDAAALDAGSYAVSFAEVNLTAKSFAQLRADVTVTGSVQGASTVENLLGTGVCDVTKDEASTVRCNAP